MKTFPLFLRVEGCRLVIVGGGEQATQKCRLLMKTCAVIDVVAAELCSELKDLVTAKKINHYLPPVTADIFANSTLVVIATGCVGADAAYAALAKQTQQTSLINVVDQPALCDLLTPAIVDRDPVVVAIGSEGTAPVLTQHLKTQIEALLSPNIGALAKIAGAARIRVARYLPKPRHRRFWRWVFTGAPRIASDQGTLEETEALIQKALHNNQCVLPWHGRLVWMISQPEPTDLITFRAVRYLQEADMIVYHSTAYRALLELARRDAERALFAYPKKQPKTTAKGALESVFISKQKDILSALNTGKTIVFIQPYALPKHLFKHIEKHAPTIECITVMGIAGQPYRRG